MANFIISYDLTGPVPTHAQVDEHLRALKGVCGRILETVWYATFEGTAQQLLRYMDQILRRDDRVIVVEAHSAFWRNLLVDENEFLNSLLAHERK